MKFTPEVFRRRLADRILTCSDEPPGPASADLSPAGVRPTSPSVRPIPFTPPPRPVPPPATRVGRGFWRRLFHRAPSVAPATALAEAPPAELSTAVAPFGSAAEDRLAAADHQLHTISSRLDVFAVETMVRSNAAEQALVGIRTDAAALRHELVGFRAGLDALTVELRALSSRQSEFAAQIRDQLADLARQPRPAAFPAGPNVVATEVEGVILGIPADEWRLAAYFTFRGLPEPGLIRCLEGILQPGAVFADVGASIGIVTLLAARRLGRAGKVYCFEPTPRTFSLLRDNIQVNGWLETGCIDLRQVAVLDRSGRAILYVHPGNSGHNSLFRGDELGLEPIEVPTVSLDDALPPGSRLDAVKIDAEGAEPLIWRGMSRLLAENPGIAVLFEFAPAHLRRAGQDPAAFLDEIAAAGFRICDIQGHSGALVDASREQLLALDSSNLCARRELAG